MSRAAQFTWRSWIFENECKDRILLFLVAFLANLCFPLKVDDWLSGLFASQKTHNTPINKHQFNDIPSFEKNKVTNDILCDLRNANLSADLQAEEEIKIMKTFIKEHVAESISYVYLECKHYLV